MNISIPITNYRNCYSQQLGEGQEQEQDVGLHIVVQDFGVNDDTNKTN